MVPIFFDCFDLLGQPPAARHSKCIQGPCNEDETYEGKAEPGEYAVDCFAGVVAEENSGKNAGVGDNYQGGA
jgi:hypothetical protein